VPGSHDGNTKDNSLVDFYSCYRTPSYHPNEFILVVQPQAHSLVSGRVEVLFFVHAVSIVIYL
jgi:hypothetical protein